MPFIIGFRYSTDDEWEKSVDQIFAEGAEAADFCKRRNALHKSWGEDLRWKVFPLPLDDPLAWKIRERTKFEDGTYQRPPWFDKYGGHYLEHIDPDDPRRIRFFLNDADAHRNRYTTMAPGRFFLNYVNSMPRPGEVEDFCAKMGLDMTVSKLQIGMTADEFERVYTEGPHSCMAYTMDKEKFFSPFHPVRLYGDLDLGVAYITRDGEITGRCLVWPDKKIHGRIYGDSARMRERLSEEGYSEDWNFKGARLHLVKNEDGAICSPYVDGDDLGGKIDGNYIVLTDEPFIILKGPEGLIEADSCSRCGNREVVLTWDDDLDSYTCCASNGYDD